jgi:hypothetical protein
MSMATGRTDGATDAVDVRRGAYDTTPERHDARETRPSFMTTEFWAMVGGIVAVVLIYLNKADASFNLWRAMVLGTAIGVGYMISRGLAKAGSRDVHDSW